MRGFIVYDTPSICWDCKNATGKCEWSSDFKPVEGWKVIETEATKAKPEGIFIIECPKFERDSYNCGSRRIPKIG